MATGDDRDQPSIGAVGHKGIQWDHLQEKEDVRNQRVPQQRKVFD